MNHSRQSDNGQAVEYIAAKQCAQSHIVVTVPAGKERGYQFRQ